MRTSDRDAPVPYRLPRSRGRVLGRPDRLVWPALAVVLVVGAAVCWAVADHRTRAAGTFAVTVAVVVVCFSVSSLNIRLANRISPGTAFVAAMFSYGATVVLMFVLLLAASPRVVDPPAVLAGSACTVVTWLAGLIRASWVR